MELHELGQKIAVMRKQKGLSQRELAKRAGITHTAVSSIESNKVSPSVSSLQKIVNVFGLSLSEFFTSNQDVYQAKTVLTPDELTEIGNEHVSMKLVCNGMKRKLGFLIETYNPRSSTGEAYIQHEGEECGTVIEGEITLILGDKRYVIKQGESYIFDTSIPHKFTNTSKGQCKIISAHTPANF